jgi:hypothetical protein
MEWVLVMVLTVNVYHVNAVDVGLNQGTGSNYGTSYV